MTKGVLLFAHNSPKYDYYKMAEVTAKRVNHFLNLPVTVITDTESLKSKSDYTFDQTITVEPNRNNKRDWGIWINKDRYQAYELSPYSETILLDTDYIVNSNKLSKLFDLETDFCCHNKTSFLMQPNAVQEVLSVYSFETLWATVVKFTKSTRCKQIFDCLSMIQSNFEHYASMHGFISATFRNDYALTLALRIANGHTTTVSDFIPWNLMHAGRDVMVYTDNKHYTNTEFVIMHENWQRGKIRKDYVVIKDMDFHVLNKDNFMELIE